jgi:hypothetical protein
MWFALRRVPAGSPLMTRAPGATPGLLDEVPERRMSNDAG